VGATRIIAFIDQPDVIEKILTDIGLWPARAHGPPEAAAAQAQLAPVLADPHADATERSKDPEL